MSEISIAERFLEIEQLSQNEDIYIEKAEPFVPFLSSNLEAVGKGFDFRDFMSHSRLKFWRHIRELVESDIPNCFFTMAWDEYFDSNKQFEDWLIGNPQAKLAREYRLQKESFSFLYEKPFWEWFAIILACRGAKNVTDVAKPLLNIFVDNNRLGMFPALCLVANNVDVFVKDICESIYIAIEEQERFWLDNLLMLLSLRYEIDRNAILQIKELDEKSQERLTKILSCVRERKY